MFTHAHIYTGCLPGKIEQLDVASSNPHRIMTAIWHLMNPRANRNHFSCLHSASIALLQLRYKVQSNTQVLVQNNKCLLITCKGPYVFIEKKFMTVLLAWPVLGRGENRFSSLWAAHATAYMHSSFSTLGHSSRHSMLLSQSVSSRLTAISRAKLQTQNSNQSTQLIRAWNIINIGLR